MTQSAAGGSDALARAQAAMELISRQARESNLRRMHVLEEALHGLTAGGLPVSNRLAAADVAHQLVGSAGTFGYSRVTQLARQVERFFLDGGAEEPTLVEIAGVMARIRADLVNGPDQGHWD